MKLAWKLSAALLVGLIAVLACFDYVRIRRDEALLERDVRLHDRIFAQALAAAVQKVYRDGGEGPARDLVRGADASRAGVSVRWVSLVPGASVENRPTATQAELASLASQDYSQIVSGPDPAGTTPDDDSLLTYVPVPGPGGGPGAIELAEPMAAKSSYLRGTLGYILGSSLVIAIVWGIIVVFLGTYLVGLPVARLVQRAERIGAGEFDTPPIQGPNDELGRLAATLNHMATQLATAQRRSETDTAARIAALEQLRHAERLSTLGHLASSLAHQLGTPLNVVIGHGRMIQHAKVVGERAVDSAAAIVEQGERIAQLFRQMLDYARRPSLKPSTADLSDVVRAATELLTPLAAENQVALSVEAQAEEDAVACVDVVQLQQAFTNLIINAIQASTPGASVTVSLRRTRARRQHDPSRPEEPWVVVSVADQGTGIPAQDLPRLFEPFFTTKPSGYGTGLGLSIAGDIVREHDGWISVTSEHGHGSRFDVYLPQVAGVVASTRPDTSGE
jgi:signal transduction histidine kinase